MCGTASRDTLLLLLTVVRVAISPHTKGPQESQREVLTVVNQESEPSSPSGRDTTRPTVRCFSVRHNTKAGQPPCARPSAALGRTGPCFRHAQQSVQRAAYNIVIMIKGYLFGLVQVQRKSPPCVCSCVHINNYSCIIGICLTALAGVA